MVTIYTEKPDVGRKVAAAIGPIILDDGTKVTSDNLGRYEKAVKAIQGKKGYIPIKFKGEECAVTHGYGHLCSLWEPKDYDEAYKNWDNFPIPFIPSVYKIKVNESTRKQFDIVSKLFNKSNYCINATDWDREGEVIFAYVYEMSGAKIPFKRAYYNSLTADALKEAFDNLHPASDVKNLESAGRCRAIADFVIGMNITVAATKKFKGKGILSNGRVLTPTLKMVVERELAIRNFQKSKYYLVNGQFITPTGEKYTGTYSEKFASRDEAERFVAKLSGSGVITDIDIKLEKQNAPSLYSLSLLQAQKCKSLGVTAIEILTMLQELYEDEVVSYPRASSTYLPEKVRADADEILYELEKTEQYKVFLNGKPHTFAKRYFNDEKVDSHHAIIPTGKHLEKIKNYTGKKAMLLDIICKSLIMTIYPAAELERTKVITKTADGTEFVTKGLAIKNMGWMEVAGAIDEKKLPMLNKNSMVKATYEIKEEEATQPSRFNDGTLIAAMKTADSSADDDSYMSLAELDVHGIGQESTRAQIIENLVSRGYVERKGKSLYATEKGINLIDNLPLEEIKSAKLTAMWETRLNNIANGLESSEQFVKDIEEMTTRWCKIIDEKMNPINPNKVTPNESELACPVCGHSLVKMSWGYGCSNYKNGCKFSVSGKIAGKTITDAQVKKLIQKGITDEIKGFTSKSGKKFNAKLKLEDGKVNFSFD